LDAKNQKPSAFAECKEEMQKVEVLPVSPEGVENGKTFVGGFGQKKRVGGENRDPAASGDPTGEDQESFQVGGKFSGRTRGRRERGTFVYEGKSGSHGEPFCEAKRKKGEVWGEKAICSRTPVFRGRGRLSGTKRQNSQAEGGEKGGVCFGGEIQRVAMPATKNKEPIAKRRANGLPSTEKERDTNEKKSGLRLQKEKKGSKGLRQGIFLKKKEGGKTRKGKVPDGGGILLKFRQGPLTGGCL